MSFFLRFSVARGETEGNLLAGWGGHGVRMENVCGSLVRKRAHGGNCVANASGRWRARFELSERGKGIGQWLVQIGIVPRVVAADDVR